MQHRKSAVATYQSIPATDEQASGPSRPWTCCGRCCVVLGALLSMMIALLLGVAGYNAAFPVRASCAADFTFNNPCFTVAHEISKRIHGQHLGGADAWHDPHNNGSYSFIHAMNPPLFKLYRVSGTASRQKYTDVVDLSFSVVNNGTCKMTAHSTSTVFSILDFSTNWCNMLNLVSSDPRARPFTRLNYTVSIGKCGEHDTDRCYTV